MRVRIPGRLQVAGLPAEGRAQRSSAQARCSPRCRPAAVPVQGIRCWHGTTVNFVPDILRPEHLGPCGRPQPSPREHAPAL